ncbi:DUF2894 domain-containing protein [Alloalcanivorax marinus]|uniref:DUF2894 domain-containing protein n=1 Tax=Alloalcanivorax marinus TaxID=1177169 RepID=UPI001931A799|nr:DUF2894 domain-containing protein [Alloalcanivorax marinus]MBL7252210.1 DUF2894 domain-containing protein [Alloalcanivorax marinus]
MSNPTVPATDLTDRLTALRGQGAARFEPVRFHYLDALARRLDGDHRPGLATTREKLERELSALEEALAAARRHTDALIEQCGDEALRTRLQALGERGEHRAARRLASAGGAPSPLGALVGELRAGDTSPAAPAGASALDALLHEQHQRLRAHHQGQSNAAPKRDLKAAADIRARHARQRTAQRIDAALAHPTGDAGPLNSHRQVVRALDQLHELAPEYLERFVGYVDTLMALEKALGNRRG